MSGGIIRVNKRGSKGYFVASNAPFNDDALTWAARGLMGYLLSKPDGWETRNSDLIARGPAGEHKLSRMLKELKDRGYMHRYRRNAGGGLFDWITEIYERPELNPHWSPSGENHPMVDQQPSGDFPSMDEPSMDEPSVDNSPINKIQNRSNTDLSNTDQPSTTDDQPVVDDVDGGERDVLSVPSDVAAAATAIAQWMGFTGNITAEMQQHGITLATLLAWAFWVKVEGGHCRNPVGVCRSKWTGNGRHGPSLPPVRWLNLAQAWLNLDDNGRLEMLSTGGQSHLLSYEFPYPDVMPAFAELHKAIRNDPPPDFLLPDYPEDDYAQPDNEPVEDGPGQFSDTAVAALTLDGESVPEVDALWATLIANEGNPAVKTWLTYSTLLVDKNTAVIVTRNSYATEWVNGRLLPSICSSWSKVAAGTPYANLEITGAAEAAQVMAA